MDRVSNMLQQMELPSVKLMEFMNIHSKNKDSVICIFEGKDAKYFSVRLDSKIGQGKWKGIDTGGKKPVLDLYKDLSSHPVYKNSYFICFIDHDFEDWFENQDIKRIYVTPCYSIENLYSTESCFVRILEHEFSITEFNENSDDFHKCIDTFKLRLNEFINAVYMFNCWVKSHRIMKRDAKNPDELNLPNIKTSDLVSITINEVSVQYDKHTPSSVFKGSNFILCEDAFDEAENWFKSKDWNTVFRGKQQADFIRSLLVAFKEDISKKSPLFFNKKIKVSLALSKDNFISEVSQYADTPECLMQFLDSVVKMYFPESIPSPISKSVKERFS